MGSSTYSRRCTEIEQNLALLEKSISSVELYKLEGSSSPVSFLFRELVPTAGRVSRLRALCKMDLFVPFVEAPFAMLDGFLACEHQCSDGKDSQFANLLLYPHSKFFGLCCDDSRRDKNLSLVPLPPALR